MLCAGCALELGSDPAATGAPLPPPASVPAPPGVELLVAAWPFEGAARGLVHGLKFGRRLSLARVAAARIASLAEGLEGDLVPVPPSPMRRAWRGFDPAEEIALALAPLLGLPLRRCLRRGHGPRQVGRPRRVRLADPPGIRVTARAGAPRAALLVDDVSTTGATLAACAGALRSAGCRRVVALVAARAALSPMRGGRTMDSPSERSEP